MRARKQPGTGPSDGRGIHVTCYRRSRCQEQQPYTTTITSPHLLPSCEPSVVYTAQNIATTCYAALLLAGYSFRFGATAPMTVTHRDMLIGARRRSTFNPQTSTDTKCHRKYPTQQRASAAKSGCSVHNAWKSRASGCLLQQQAVGRTHLSSADLSLPSRHWSGPFARLRSCFCLSPMSSSHKIMWNSGHALRPPAEVAFLPEYASRVSFRQTLRASGRCGPTPTHKRLLTVGPTSSDFKLLVL